MIVRSTFRSVSEFLCFFTRSGSHSADSKSAVGNEIAPPAVATRAQVEDEPPPVDDHLLPPPSISRPLPLGSNSLSAATTVCGSIRCRHTLPRERKPARDQPLVALHDLWYPWTWHSRLGAWLSRSRFPTSTQRSQWSLGRLPHRRIYHNQPCRL